MVTDNTVVTTTDYAGAYIYENSSLKFVNHPEGYIEPNGAGGYDYVYQYKDFWSNVRISYSDGNEDGVVDASEIRREQNYYPYGLEHRGYNGSTSGVKNNLKTYQGQEIAEDLGLNTHEWKYRMSDPAIGRFWQIDPLSEDYVYNSTYAFQENKMGLGIELEGLELQYVNPVNLFNFKDGKKPVLTFGLHHIKLPMAERSTEGGVGAFIGNTAKSIWNGVASTWNAGMEGENMGDITSEGFAEMGDMARRIENGEGTIEDAENITAAVVMTAAGGKSSKKGLGNQFKNKTVNQVNKAMEKHVKSGKLEKKYTDPVSGSTAYKNTKSGYSYNVDTGKSGKTGKKVEPSHIDVNYPNPKPKNVPNKKKLPIKQD